MITGLEHVEIFAKDTKPLSDWCADLFRGKNVCDNSIGAMFFRNPEGNILHFTSIPECLV